MQDPEALVALQTVWSPTHEDDRMSSAELEARYPELRRLDDGVGRVQRVVQGRVGEGARSLPRVRSASGVM